MIGKIVLNFNLKKYIMKLLKMTDYVLEQNRVLEIYINHDKGALFKRCLNYAEFLKQPLKLEMFVPCDEDGEPLEKPTDEEIEKFKGLAFSDFDMDYTRIFNYFEAKEKVLFENATIKKVEDYYIVSIDNYTIFTTYNKYKIIEDLTDYQCEFKLTQSANK